MADAKITELTEATAITSDDLIPIVDAPGGSATTKKITWNNLSKSTITNAVTVTIPDAANTSALVVTQNDTTNNPDAVTITNAGTGNALFIDQNAASGTGPSSYGSLLIDNTGSTGASINAYSRNNTPSRHVIFNVAPAYQTLMNTQQVINTSSTSITVDSTTDFPSSGTLRILNATSVTENGKIIFIHYTSTDATHFTGTAGVFYKAEDEITIVDNAIVYYMNTSTTYINTLIEDCSTQGGSVNLKLRGPNPDLEWHALGGYYNDGGEGQFEIDVPMGDNVVRTSTDVIRINGRNDANNSFEPIAIFARPGASGQGMVGIGFQNKTDPTTLSAHLHIKNDDADGDTAAASLVGEIIQGADSQTADLIQFKNDGGDTLASVEADGDISTTGVIKVDATQVVGPRVVDARADDAINTSSWDSTTAGVLDALRDAMITHGLISAS